MHTSMKKKNSKRLMRKIVPLHYQKRNLSKSNSSLSHLLSFASYKKRSNDLAKNNRILAAALQEARLERAYQSNILKNYARNENQIMFARLKLQGMAKCITKLVTDLHEVLNCLDVNLAPSSLNYFQTNGPAPERLKIKVPAVESIEEVSVLVSENGKSAGSSTSEPTVTSDGKSSDEASCSKEDLNEIQLNASDCGENLANDVDMPPVLFVDNFEDKERHSKKSKNSRKSTAVNQISLTPELDIDLSYVTRKRSSSRRQTHFIPSTSSSGRSSRKSELDLALEYATPKKSVLSPESVAHRKLSSFSMDCQEILDENEDPENAVRCSKKTNSSPLTHFEQNLKKKETSECTFVNMRERGSKNANNSPSDSLYDSVHLTGQDVNLDKQTSGVPLTVVSANANLKNENNNHTILFCEDMELTEVLRPVEQTILEKPPSAVGSPLSNSDAHFVVSRETEKINTIVEKICCEDKLTENSECVAVISKETHLNEINNGKNYSIIGNVKTCNSTETFQNAETSNENHSVSPLHRRSSRSRKNIMYKVFLSSSESESDSSPINANNKKHKKVQRDTVIFKPKSCKKTSNTKDNCKSVEKGLLKKQLENNELQNPLSVFDLDVSNSKKAKKRGGPKGRANKSSYNKEITKPLSQTCSVTKLKGINYRFTKKKSSLGKVKENQQLLKCDSLSEANPMVSANEAVKETELNLSSNKGEDAISTENRETINTVGDEMSTSGIKESKQQEMSFKSPKCEARRVSFASTDLVCNFTKTSVSKTIAANKKTHRASKSVFNFEDMPNLQKSEPKNSMLLETNKSSKDITQQPPDELFNFSEDTELYTFILPSNTHQTSSKVDEPAPPKSTFSVKEPSNIYDSYDLNLKKNQLSVNKKIGKLSLKGNKSCQRKVQLYNPGKKDVRLKSLDTDSPNAKSKCTLSDKELSLNDIKENIVHTIAQTFDISQAVIQNKTRISGQSHLPPDNDFDISVPVDDIRLVKKPSQKKGNLSQKHQLSLPAIDKKSKKSSNQIFVESSPVLKDVQNLEEVNAESRNSTKRRSKAVCYKEPSLNKKMRRK